MLRKSIAAALLVAGAAFVPAAAHAVTGFTTEPTELHAGPDYDYPIIRTINYDRRVEIFGCLDDWSFCDVGYHSDRGWVDGRDIVVDYRARRVSLLDAGPYVGIGFLSFSFGNYWDTYYRGRPFYTDRGRWERHYHDHYRASWGRDGDRRYWNDRNRYDNGRRDWNDRNRRDNDRRDWNDRNRGGNDRRGDNDRRTDNDRRDNDRTINRTVTTPSPNTGVTQRNVERAVDTDRDINRRTFDNRTRDDNTRREIQQRSAPQAVPAPQASPRTPAVDRPNRAMGNDRPARPERVVDPGNRQRMDRPDRGASEHRDRPQREEHPQQRPKQDDDNRPDR